MHGLNHKLLSIFLTVLIAVAPMGSAFAAALSPEQGGADMSMHQMHLPSDASVASDDAAQVACEHCNTGCCTQGSCSSAACGSCATPIAVSYVSSISLSHARYATPEFLVELARVSGSPFRPPRA